jgi:peptidoglycan/LPS O-acetylase OafA/YrhL
VGARRSDIQGLRALAVLLVVAFHADLPIPGGFIGVDVFFVISGFVITSMLVRQLEAGRMSFALFYARRFRRLLPALAVLTTATMLLSAALLSPLGPQQATAGTGFAASTFLANIQLSLFGGGDYFDLAAETNAVLHIWSLSVEEQFYFVFPALLFLAWHSAKRNRAALIITAVTAASFAYSCYATYYHAIGVTAFYSPAARVWEFGVGSLLALAAPVLVRLGARLAHALGIIGVGLVGALAASRQRQSSRGQGRQQWQGRRHISRLRRNALASQSLCRRR